MKSYPFMHASIEKVLHVLNFGQIKVKDTGRTRHIKKSTINLLLFFFFFYYYYFTRKKQEERLHKINEHFFRCTCNKFILHIANDSRFLLVHSRDLKAGFKRTKKKKKKKKRKSRK